MLKAKTVMPERFWILEDDNGIKQGTISVQSSTVKVMVNNVEKVYESLDKACWDLGINFVEPNIDEEIEEVVDEKIQEEVMGYPTKCIVFNPTWDIKRKIPIFTKTSKSRTLHAAGFYIIHFEHGWAHSFCPKVSTLDANEYQGPFKDRLEMKERLRLANANTVN